MIDSLHRGETIFSPFLHPYSRLLMIYQVRFFSPYTQEWKVQEFDTLERANSMVAFYRSCGTSAHLVSPDGPPITRM